jgi:hypothetical protein
MHGGGVRWWIRSQTSINSQQHQQKERRKNSTHTYTQTRRHKSNRRIFKFSLNERKSLSHSKRLDLDRAMEVHAPTARIELTKVHRSGKNTS